MVVLARELELKATPLKVSHCTILHRRDVSEIRQFLCATLAILDRLDEVDHPTLSWWLAERQLPNGGLNGRSEKLEDVRSLLVNAYTN